MSDKRSDTFFKVFYDRMKDAQQEIKNTITVNTSDSQQRHPDRDKEEKRKRGKYVDSLKMSSPKKKTFYKVRSLVQRGEECDVGNVKHKQNPKRICSKVWT